MSDDSDAVAKLLATVKEDSLYAEIDQKLTGEDRILIEETLRSVAGPLVDLIASLDEACKDESVIEAVRAKLAENSK